MTHVQETTRQLIHVGLKMEIHVWTPAPPEARKEETLYYLILNGSRTANCLREVLPISKDAFYRIKNFNHLHFQEEHNLQTTQEENVTAYGIKEVWYYIHEDAPANSVNPLTGKTAEQTAHELVMRSKVIRMDSAQKVPVSFGYIHQLLQKPEEGGREVRGASVLVNVGEYHSYNLDPAQFIQQMEHFIPLIRVNNNRPEEV